MTHLPEFHDELGAVHLIDHPWVLADCPLELLAAMWNDALYLDDVDAGQDGTDLMAAWQTKHRQLREALR